MTYSEVSELRQVNSRGYHGSNNLPLAGYDPEKHPLIDEISARIHSAILDSGILEGLDDYQLDDLDNRLVLALSGIKRLSLKRDGTPYKPPKKQQRGPRNA